MAALVLGMPATASGSVLYGYDPLGRVTTALYDNGTCVIYAYDPNGNRTSQVTIAASASAPLWGTATWGEFTWASAAQSPIWGGGTWGCFQWTPH